MFGLGYGEFLTGLLLVKAGLTFLWQEYQKGQQAFLKLLGRSQTQAAKNLSDALGVLVVRGKNKGIDSFELYRNLEKLLPLLCRDASQRRVNDQVRAACAEILVDQAWAVKRNKASLGDALCPVKPLRRLLLCDPECAEFFEATKGDAEKVGYPELKSAKWQNVKLIRHSPLAKVGVEEELALLWSPVFRKSAEDIFDTAKEIHDTQREFAAVLREHDGLRSSHNPTDHDKASSKQVEAKELLDKLYYLFNDYTSPLRKSDSIFDIARSRLSWDWDLEDYRFILPWCKAAYSILWLIGRFGLSRVLEPLGRRQREIAALFDAVGATDAEREEIKTHINILYGTIHRSWLKDEWIKRIGNEVRYLEDYRPFLDQRFHGWRKATSKRRVLFLEHYDLFQFKSPRQLTEEGVLGLVQTMEAHEDTVFVRTSRLNSELQEILNRAVNNERHGKFDAAIADLKSLLRRVSEASGPNAVDYADETLSMIHCYLACIYASRGEHLEEAVELAKRAMRIHDTWLTRLAIGWSYHQLGKVPAAIKALEAAKAEAMHAGSGLLPLVHLVLGDAYRDAERYQDAEEAWREGWRLADDPAWKDQAELTSFEVKERADLRKELGERLG